MLPRRTYIRPLTRGLEQSTLNILLFNGIFQQHKTCHIAKSTCTCLSTRATYTSALYLPAAGRFPLRCGVLHHFFSLAAGGCFVRLALTVAREAQLINLSIGDLLFLPWEGIFTQQRHELRRHLTPPKLRCVDQVILLLSHACALEHTARLLLASRQLVQNPWSARPTLLGAAGVQQPPRNAKRAQVRQRMKTPAFPIIARRDTSLSSYPPTAYSARWRRSRSGTY